MRRMQRIKVLVVVGAILIFLGISILLPSFVSDSISDTITIPAGSDWHYYLEFGLPAGGQVTGDFEETLGRTVDFHLFSESQYNSYYNGIPTGSLYHDSGSSGTFSVTVPESSKYYMVFDHGSGYASSSQSVRVNAQIIGFNVILAAIALIFAVIGIALIVSGYMSKKKLDKLEGPATPRDSDVIMFQR